MGRPRSAPEQQTAAAERKRTQDIERTRERTRRGADIGEIPPVQNPERRRQAEASFEYFAVEYFPHSTGSWPMSPDHARGNTRCQDAADNGGRSIEALPRGSGKTTRSEVFAIWCGLTGRRSFVAVFGSESTKAQMSIDSIKMELTENDLLYEDFPEVCHPVRALEGKPQRCSGQTFRGESTHIEWTADTIVLPKIPGSKASGAIVSCHGLMASSRGLRYKRADGVQARPDLVILDDIQTDESAASAVQIAKRLAIIKKNILKLGGHGKTLAVVCNATVIARDDVIDQLLADPAWQGVRVKAVRAWSKRHDDLWMGDYKRIRQTYDKEIDGDQLRAWREATEFYRTHREAMDESCEVYWEHCYDRDQELSATQHFYNALIDDGPEVFASEYQQEPLADESRTDAVRPAELVSHAINVPAGVVPAGCTTLTAFVDVQESCLYWLVAAWGPQLRGHVVAYGTYPDQHRGYFALREVEKTLRMAASNAPLADAMHMGLEVVAREILDREFQSEDTDAVHRVNLLLVDANWAQTADVTRDFARRSRHGTRLMPSHGRYVGASRQTMSDKKADPGERVGAHWRTSTIKKQRHILFDTNWWKSLIAGRMKLGANDPIAFTFHSGRHEMLFDHIASEYPTRTENKSTGRTVDEWQLIPGRDNHFLDCLIGSAVAASVAGVSAVGAEQTKVPSRKVITREEMAARRAALIDKIGR